MGLPEILELVTTRLEAVPTVKNVWNYKRLAVASPKFKALFQDPEAQKLHTWFVVRESSPAADEGTQAYRRIHNMVLMGYYAVSDTDASELAFNAIIQDVCDAFDPLDGRTYAGAVDWSGPLQVDGPTSLMFGPVLCHAVKISHRIEDFLQS